MSKNRILTLLLSLIIATALPSCAHKKKEETAESAYKKTMEYFQEGSYDFAAQQFEKIEDDYPFSEYAIKAQVMAAYSYYKAKSYEDSLRVIDYFISMNSTDSNIEYMYYLRSMDYYARIQSYKKSFENARLAKSTLQELILRFPNSAYTPDAKEKLKDVNDNLAASEMYVGRFYLDNKNYIGAIDKFNAVILNQDYSRFHPEAYYRLIEVYSIIGLEKEAKKSYDVLRRKYSDTKWFEYGKKIINSNNENS